jgi:hypothetical protein
MPTPRLIPEIISAAIDGYGAQKIRIDDKIAELRAMLDGGAKPTAATPEPPKRKRRKMSAAGRKAISDATKKRWAAFHAAKQKEKSALAKKTATTKTAPKKAAAADVKQKRLAALTKARAAKATKKATQQPTA